MFRVEGITLTIENQDGMEPGLIRERSKGHAPSTSRVVTARKEVATHLCTRKALLARCSSHPHSDNVQAGHTAILKLGRSSCTKTAPSRAQMTKGLKV